MITPGDGDGDATEADRSPNRTRSRPAVYETTYVVSAGFEVVTADIWDDTALKTGGIQVGSMIGTPGGSSRRSCCHDASAGVRVASGVGDGSGVALAAWVALGRLTVGEGTAVGASGAHAPSHATNAETAMR